MNKSLAIGLLAASAVVAQQAPPPPPPTPPDARELGRQMRDQVRDQVRLATKDMKKVHVELGTVSYDAGTRALDEHKYDEAIRRFNGVIDGKSPRADGALYWKAYALNRAGRRDEALASLATLRQNYPASRWLNDAQALESEVKQGSGQAISPADETNEDLKLMAINSLMNADPERAMPLLEGLLKGNSAPGLKDRALFVITQNRSPRARQVLFEYAKGAGNPDLQLRAIRYIGMSGTSDAQQQLSAVYTASNDPDVKREIIRSLMVSMRTCARKPSVS